MIALEDISKDVLIARGQYSTVRAAHEDSKKDLQMLCGQLSSIASQVLRRMQPDNDDVPQSVDALLATARQTIDMMQECVTRLESLAKQRQELKVKAWK